MFEFIKQIKAEKAERKKKEARQRRLNQLRDGEEWWKPFPLEFPCIYGHITENAHTLIAGTTGSGKSVFIRSLIAWILCCNPDQNQLAIVDPKMVDYYDLRDDPHIYGYSATPAEYEEMLYNLIGTMHYRIQTIRDGSFQGRYSDIYCIIDEYPDVMQKSKKAVRYIEELTRLARVANIHIIIATQRPTRDVISGVIAANTSVKVALRCTTAQESRNILGVNGAEILPQYGKALIRYPQGVFVETWDIKPTPPETFKQIQRYWASFFD